VESSETYEAKAKPKG